MLDSMTVSYISSRREVWRWYWQQWRRRLWLYQLLFVAAIVTTILVINGGKIDDRSMTTATALSVAALTFLIMFPQIMFKPRARTLTIDANGIRTTIGGKEQVVA